MDLQDWRPPPAPSPARFRELRDYGEADALAQAMEAEGDLIAARRERGARAFIGWMGDEPAAYGWLSEGPEWIGEIGRQITPAPGEAYVWNCVTLPPYRRQGVFRALLRHVCAAAAEEGRARLWIASLAGSAESAAAQVGFQPAIQVVEGRLSAASGADAALVEAAAAVLAARAGEHLPALPVPRH